jgi:hypothetical protein
MKASKQRSTTNNRISPSSAGPSTMRPTEPAARTAAAQRQSRPNRKGMNRQSPSRKKPKLPAPACIYGRPQTTLCTAICPSHEVVSQAPSARLLPILVLLILARIGKGNGERGISTCDQQACTCVEMATWHWPMKIQPTARSGWRRESPAGEQDGCRC